MFPEACAFAEQVLADLGVAGASGGAEADRLAALSVELQRAAQELQALAQTEQRDAVEAAYVQLSCLYSEFRRRRAKNVTPVPCLQEGQLLPTELVLRCMGFTPSRDDPAVVFEQFPVLSRSTRDLAVGSPELLGVFPMLSGRFLGLCSSQRPRTLGLVDLVEVDGLFCSLWYLL